MRNPKKKTFSSPTSAGTRRKKGKRRDGQRAKQGREATGSRRGGKEGGRTLGDLDVATERNTKGRQDLAHSTDDQVESEKRKKGSRSINSSQHQRSVQRKLHVGSSRSLGSSSRDLNTDVGSRDDDLGEGDRVIGDEDDLESRKTRPFEVSSRFVFFDASSRTSDGGSWMGWDGMGWDVP